MHHVVYRASLFRDLRVKQYSMAEVVHRNLELMLPDLEELERSGIFSPEEIKYIPYFNALYLEIQPITVCREIVRRRRSMEYKLQRRPVRKEDYLQAIKVSISGGLSHLLPFSYLHCPQYEFNLDRLRKARKKVF